MTSKHKSLIVIPCLNEEQYIKPLVTSLITNNEGATIVIADGGSSDNTIQIAKDLAASHDNVVYLHNPKQIQSAAINLAVDTYGNDFEYLIRLDAHANYPDDYCKILLQDAQNMGADCVVVAMNTIGKSGFQIAVAAAQNSKIGNGGSAHRNAGGDGEWVDHGHHALMHISAFRAVSGYDESFSHNEDADLDIRLSKAGYKIWLSGNTHLDYYPRAHPLALLRQYYKFGYGRAKTVLKHKLRPKPRQLAPAAIAPAAILALAYPVICIAIMPLAMWAVICLAYGVLLGIKAKNPAIMLAGLAAMIMHFGWSFGFWRGIIRGGK